MALLVSTNLIILTGTFIGLYYFFIPCEATLNAQTIGLIGSIARLCSLTYCLPQVVKNRMLKSTHAISIRFIVLNLMLAILDTASAWCLNWGWPNKLASPLTVLIMSAMLVQVRHYSASVIKSPAESEPRPSGLRERHLFLNSAWNTDYAEGWRGGIHLARSFRAR